MAHCHKLIIFSAQEQQQEQDQDTARKHNNIFIATSILERQLTTNLS